MPLLQRSVIRGTILCRFACNNSHSLTVIHRLSNMKRMSIKDVHALHAALRVLSLFILLVLVTSCSIAIKAPKLAFGAVDKAEGNGYEVDDAFNSSIVYVPGFTWSISGTYLPPSIFNRSADGDKGNGSYSYTYAYTANHSFGLKIKFPFNCSIPEKSEYRLTKALNAVLDDVNGFPANGKVSMQLTDHFVRRYALSGSWGRSFRLDYKTPCFTGHGGASIWYAAMVAMHESTHSALKLAEGLPKGSSGREDLAIGAESCLLASLNINSYEFNWARRKLEDRVSESIALQGKAFYDIYDLCNNWKSFMLRANRLRR